MGEGRRSAWPAACRGEFRSASCVGLRVPSCRISNVGPLPNLAADSCNQAMSVLVEKLVGERNSRSFGLRQIPEVSGAIIAMDPHTGRVLAMAGGYSYEMSQFNNRRPQASASLARHSSRSFI